MKYFYLDCKTGGNKPKMSLFSLYGLVLNNNFQIVDTIDLKIKPNNGQYIFDIKHLKDNNIDIIKHDSEAINQIEASKKFNNFCFKNGKLGKLKLMPIGCDVSDKFLFIKKHLLNVKEIKQTFLNEEIDINKVANFLKVSGKLPHNLNCDLFSIADYFNISYSKIEQNDKLIADVTINVLRSLINIISEQNGKEI